ncbi:MAG: hypothetical protein ACFCGT_01530 [Sandaracinaceae bacterium]
MRKRVPGTRRSTRSLLARTAASRRAVLAVCGAGALLAPGRATAQCDPPAVAVAISACGERSTVFIEQLRVELADQGGHLEESPEAANLVLWVRCDGPRVRLRWIGVRDGAAPPAARVVESEPASEDDVRLRLAALAAAQDLAARPACAPSPTAPATAERALESALADARVSAAGRATVDASRDDTGPPDPGPLLRPTPAPRALTAASARVFVRAGSAVYGLALGFRPHGAAELGLSASAGPGRAASARVWGGLVTAYGTFRPLAWAFDAGHIAVGLRGEVGFLGFSARQAGGSSSGGAGAAFVATAASLAVYLGAGGPVGLLLSLDGVYGWGAAATARGEEAMVLDGVFISAQLGAYFGP